LGFELLGFELLGFELLGFGLLGFELLGFGLLGFGLLGFGLLGFGLLGFDLSVFVFLVSPRSLRPVVVATLLGSLLLFVQLVPKEKLVNQPLLNLTVAPLLLLLNPDLVA
jgi:hypothetical protein